MQPHSLLGQEPSQAVKDLRSQTKELPDDQVFEQKKEYLDTAQRYGMDDHVQALEDAYWDDIIRTAKESYTPDRRAAEEALYWHTTRDLFNEHDLKDLAHHNLNTDSAYRKLANELDSTGSIHTTDNDILYHFINPDELHRRTHEDHDREHIHEEVDDLQNTLPLDYLPH